MSYTNLHPAKLTLYFFSVLSLLLFSNCSDDDADAIPIMSTGSATDITDTSAILEGQVITESSDAVTAAGFEYSITEDFAEGNGTKMSTQPPAASVFTAKITGLTGNTMYYYKAYATTSKGTYYGPEKDFETTKPQVVDIDGNVYPIVTLGNQTWMAENLRVTQYANGRDIPQIKDNTAWSALENNNIDDAYDILYSNKFYLSYGLLYTYAAAIGGQSKTSDENIQGVCPKDWHLPNAQEWQELLDYVTADGQTVQALMSLKDWGGNGTDYYGFNLQASGYRWDIDGSFKAFETYGNYWSSSSQLSETDSYAESLKIYQTDVAGVILGRAKSTGMCIRCIKD